MADGGAFKPALLVIDFQEDFCPPVRHTNTSLHQHHHPAAYRAVCRAPSRDLLPHLMSPNTVTSPHLTARACISSHRTSTQLTLTRLMHCYSAHTLPTS